MIYLGNEMRDYYVEFFLYHSSVFFALFLQKILYWNKRYKASKYYIHLC